MKLNCWLSHNGTDVHHRRTINITISLHQIVLFITVQNPWGIGYDYALRTYVVPISRRWSWLVFVWYALKTASAWKEIFLLFHMYSLCHNLSREGGINASSKGELSICLPRKGISVWREDIDYKKKIHNLNFENYVLFCRQNWGLKPRAQPLRELWGTASKS